MLVNTKYADIHFITRAHVVAVFIAVHFHRTALHQRQLPFFVQALPPAFVLSEPNAGGTGRIDVVGRRNTRLGGGFMVDEHFGPAAGRDANDHAAVIPQVNGIRIEGTIGIGAFHVHNIAGIGAAGNPVALFAHVAQNPFGKTGTQIIVGGIFKLHVQKGVRVGGCQSVDGS